MDPNNQQPYQPPEQAYSANYLDQIASSSPKRSGPSKILLFAGGGILFLVVALLIGLLFTSGIQSSSEVAINLHAQLDTLKGVSKKQHSKLRDNVLRNHNSALTLQLTNASANLKVALEAEGVKVDKKDKKLKAEQKALTDELTDKFEEAGLNMQLDRTYAREMAYQLDIVNSMITSIANRTKSPPMISFVADNDSNLRAIGRNLSEFTGAK